MKHFALYLGLATALVASCSIQEKDFKTPQQDDVVFYASFEQPGDEGTKVYANDDLLLRWTADDRVSIFNKITYNQEYKFIGETGDYEGGFNKVGDPEFITGKEIPHVVSVYPFQRLTRVSEEEVVEVSFPSEQSYAPGSFGLGANIMVSVSSGNLLYYKNVGGFLMLKLYGEGISVSSITLKGNNSEKLAGKASITMPLDGVPSVTMASDAADVITLTCSEPVQLGATEEESAQFWFVVPPVTFSKGFTITVKDPMGRVFEKSTAKNVAIERNILFKMAPSEVIIEPIGDSIISFADEIVKELCINNAGWDTNGDGEISYNEARAVTSFSSVLFSYRNITSFDEFRFFTGITSIPESAFIGNGSLVSIILPNSIKSIGTNAFHSCTGLTEIVIPESVESITGFYGCKNLVSVTLMKGLTTIGPSAFNACGFESIIVPESVTSIGVMAFENCKSLKSITIPKNVAQIGSDAFAYCESLGSLVVDPDNSVFDSRNDCNAIIETATNTIVHSCKNTIIPSSVTNIARYAFFGQALPFVRIPSSVTNIERRAFWNCEVEYIIVDCVTPPLGGEDMFGEDPKYPIYVPAESVDIYKAAEHWRYYSDNIQAIPSSTPVPEAVDLGLPSGLKWASFNLGASKPEEYGDYYAWGETEPYYESVEPLNWKEGKEGGYWWPSYKWCFGSDKTLTKYCHKSSYGYNGFTDGKTLLDLDDDAAHVNLGDNWRIPTDAEWTELRENCTWTLTIKNGVNGRLVTGGNGNSIYIPAAGYRIDTRHYAPGTRGYYLSSSLNMVDPSGANGAYFDSDSVLSLSSSRDDGYPVRPVYGANNEVSISVEASADLLYVNGDSVHIDPIRYEGFHQQYLTDNDLEDIFIDLTKNASPYTSAVLSLSVYDAVSGGLLRNESYGVVYNIHTGHYDFASLDLD